MIAIAATVAATEKAGAANAAIEADGGVKVVGATAVGENVNIANDARKGAMTIAALNAAAMTGEEIIAEIAVDTTTAATGVVMIIATIGGATIIGATADVTTTVGIIGDMIAAIVDIAGTDPTGRPAIMVTVRGRATAMAISALSTASSIIIRAMTRLGGLW